MTWILYIFILAGDLRHIDKIGPFGTEASCNSAKAIIYNDLDGTRLNIGRINKSVYRFNCIQVKEWPHG